MKKELLTIAMITTMLSCNVKEQHGKSPASEIAKTQTPKKTDIISDLLSQDPLAKYFWPIRNTGQTSFASTSGQTGSDLNLINTITQKIEGEGVRVAISDTGVEVNHEDLKGNALSSEHRNYFAYNMRTNHNPYPETKSALDAHGTNVAGIISAVSSNNLGSRGIAPQAKFAAFKYVGSPSSTKSRQDQTQGKFDIFNYSYGSLQCKITKASINLFRSLAYQSNTGRDKKGAIFIKAAGNEWAGDRTNCPGLAGDDSKKYYGNSNHEAENTTPYYIVVGATNARGEMASYASPGSNIWVVAPGGEDGKKHPGIITTDLSGCDAGRASMKTAANPFEYNHPLNPTCNYTSRMNGSSAATPMVTGVVAFMLEANPSLTWRDVKLILATTAKKVKDSSYVSRHPNRKANIPSGYTYQEGWITNKAGFNFHNWYGFGELDGDTAVELAKIYQSNLNPLKLAFNELSYNSNYKSSPNMRIPDFNAKGATDSIVVNHNLIIEGVQLKLSAEHESAQELAIELYSPSGTKSIILNGQSGIVDRSFSDILLGTNALYGEQSQGVWKIKVIDTKKGNDGGILKDWSLLIYGRVPKFLKDKEPPSPPTDLNIIKAVNISSMKSPMFYWTPSTSKDVVRYEVAVGNSIDSTNILDWIDIGKVNKIQLTLRKHKIRFSKGRSYYFKFRAVDGHENTSVPVVFQWVIK